MPIAQGLVLPPTGNVSDGQSVSLLAGKQGDLLNSQLHPESYVQTYRGNTFHASTTPLGLAIPIYTATAPTVALWNPAGSGKNLVLQRIGLAYASGTSAYTAVGIMRKTGAGSAIATGAVFSAFAESTPINGLIGSGNVSVAKVSISGTNTLTAAGVAGDWVYTLAGVNLEAATGTAHATERAVQDLGGLIILAPGSAIWLGATLASVSLFTQSLCWTEVPA